MKKAALLFFLLIAFFFFGCGSHSKYSNLAGEEQKIHFSLDSTMNKFADSGFSGLVLVTYKGKVLLYKPHTKLSISLDTNTAFWVGSVTKQFTATAILKLQEEKKLNVTDSISRFFKNVPKDKQAITIRHLLSHTSGLGQNYIADGIKDRNEFIQKVLAEKLARPIDSVQYSSDGYALLAAIIEITSGLSYEEYIKRELFIPAGMKHSGFWGKQDEVNITVAQSLFMDSIKTKPFYHNMYKDDKPYPNWGARGCSGIFSTPADLYIWLKALEENKVITEKSKEMLYTPYAHIRTDKGNIDVSYAYGWVVATVNGKRIESRHSGDEDFLSNSFIRNYNNDNIIITMAYDYDPNKRPMSTEAVRRLSIVMRPYFNQN